MGKSMLLRVIMRQDIEQGNGFALFDPHSELAEAILSECSHHPEALEKVWLIEPHSPFTVPFNPLSIPDGLPLYPQVLTLLDLFRRSWSDFWGPRVEEVMRACLITLAEQKLTLAELPLLLTEPSVRKALTGSIRHEETKQFWHRFDSLSPSLQALYAEPVINRVNRFLSDPSVKAMLCSQNGINLSERMDEGAIILINLSKGQLKEISLIGSLLLAQFYWAALSRLNKLSHQRRLFTIYLDEFQNFLTESGHAEEMLAEVRKCRVGLVMVTQCLAFLDRTLRASVLANTTLQVFFRLNPQDAGLVSGEISLANRKFWMQKLLTLPPRQAVCLLRG
jgi:type IV secretory pathway TraG/TraD family ATPase VirD4